MSGLGIGVEGNLTGEKDFFLTEADLDLEYLLLSFADFNLNNWTAPSTVSSSVKG